jgi:ADP-heptose:LPS heptosyltransferase
MKKKQKFKSFILKVLTKKKKNDFNLKKTKKVLMLRYDKIGDMIITTPVFRELKTQYPNIEINVLASKSNAIILKNNPYIDKVYLNNKNNLFLDFPLLLKLRRLNIDVCFEFDHSVVRHAIIRLIIINPKKVISVNKKGRYGVDGLDLNIYDYYTDKRKDAHFRDIWLDILKPLDVIPVSNKYDIFLEKEHENRANTYIKKYKNKLLIGINLEGKVKGKKIHYQELNEICEGLFNINTDIQIIIITEPDKEQNIEKEIINMNLNYVSQAYRTNSILEAAALINKLHMIISPDTAIVHIASTFNKPVISIHENNYESYKLFAPCSELSRTIFSNNTKSLEGFSVAALLIAARELMELLKTE